MKPIKYKAAAAFFFRTFTYAVLFTLFILGIESMIVALMDRFASLDNLIKTSGRIGGVYLIIFTVSGLLFNLILNCLFKVRDQKGELNYHLWFYTVLIYFSALFYYLNRRFVFYADSLFILANIIMGALFLGVFLLGVHFFIKKFSNDLSLSVWVNFWALLVLNIFFQVFIKHNQIILENRFFTLFKLISAYNILLFLTTLTTVILIWIIYKVFVFLHKKDKKLSYIKNYVRYSYVIFFAAIIINFSLLKYKDPFAEIGNHLRISSQSRPNVIIILIDALRKKNLGCYGYRSKTSPNIDELCLQAIRFNHAYSPSNKTPEAIGSLFGSLYPRMTNLALNQKLPDEVITLAESLRDAGYMTASFSANPYISHDYNFTQGFDFTYSSSNVPQFLMTPIIKFLSILLAEQLYGHDLLDVSLFYEEIKDLNKKVVKFIEKAKVNPFFLYWHINDVHGPYLPPKKYLQNYDHSAFVSYWDLDGIVERGEVLTEAELNNIVQRYDAGIKYVDDELGKFVSFLKKINLYNNTIIVILADHGEEFMDHGKFGHGHTFYNELINVPLIIKPAGTFLRRHSVNQEVSTNVSLIDIYPTILDLINAQDLIVKNNPLGQSLVPLIQGETEGFKRRPVYISASKQKRKALVVENWKLIIEKDKELLFDLEEDPNELKNVIDLNKEQVIKLREVLGHYEQMDRQYQIVERKPGSTKDPKIVERLRSLGYTH